MNLKTRGSYSARNMSGKVSKACNLSTCHYTSRWPSNVHSNCAWHPGKTVTIVKRKRADHRNIAGASSALAWECVCLMETIVGALNCCYQSMGLTHFLGLKTWRWGKGGGRFCIVKIQVLWCWIWPQQVRDLVPKSQVYMDLWVRWGVGDRRLCIAKI